jgi:hypothetical protein
MVVQAHLIVMLYVHCLSPYYVIKCVFVNKLTQFLLYNKMRSVLEILTLPVDGNQTSSVIVSK